MQGTTLDDRQYKIVIFVLHSQSNFKVLIISGIEANDTILAYALRLSYFWPCHQSFVNYQVGAGCWLKEFFVLYRNIGSRPKILCNDMASAALKKLIHLA